MATVSSIQVAAEGAKNSLSRLSACGIALVAFAAGSLFTARLVHMDQVWADSNRVFELRVYHVVPGKVPALQSEFRDRVTALFAKHDMKAVGYFVPEDAPASDNIHPNRDEAKKHWAAFRADPVFQEMLRNQQTTGKLVEKADITYMDPTDFSPMK
jgi:hypothetical protein